MKLNPDYILREVADTWIILPVGETTVNFNGMLKLNNSGQLLWNGLKQGSDRSALAEILTNKYEVSFTQALADVDDFIECLKKIGCIEE